MDAMIFDDEDSEGHLPVNGGICTTTRRARYQPGLFEEILRRLDRPRMRLSRPGALRTGLSALCRYLWSVLDEVTAA